MSKRSIPLLLHFHTLHHLNVFSLKNEQKNAEQMRSKIKNLFAGDESELKAEIDAYEQEHTRKVRKLSDTKNAQQEAKDKLGRIDRRLEDNDRTYVKMLQEASREQDLYEERAAIIKNLCGRLDITPDFDVANSNERATALIPDIEEKLDARQATGLEMDSKFKSAESNIEHEIGKYREDEVRLTSEISSWDQQLQELDMEMRKQKKSASSAEENRKLLIDVQTRIGKLQEVKAQYERTHNKVELKNEIDGIQAQINEVDDEIENITLQIVMFNTLSKLQHDVTSKEKHIEQRKAESNRLKNKHREKLVRLFGDEIIEGNFKKRVETMNQHLRVEANRLEAIIRKRDREKGELQANLRSMKSELHQTENDIHRLEGEIDAMCDSTPFAEVLATAKDNVKKLQMEHSSLISSENYYKR